MSTCEAHHTDRAYPRAITMAFQPVVDLRENIVFAHEALVRGKDGASAGDMLASVHAGNRSAFEQCCRATAIDWAQRLQLPGLLSINFMPNVVHEADACTQPVATSAGHATWPLTRIIIEVNEQEAVADLDRLLVILKRYHAQGILTAIDDFGAGYSGLKLLADFQPDLLKLDLALVRGVALDRTRQVIIRHTVRLCEELGVRIIAEGVETADDCHALYDIGIFLQQGYFFARPLIEQLPVIHFGS
jgi:EAL domain-containing protein (putative c-di-GMP-specific phosphodiesterase class I)